MKERIETLRLAMQEAQADEMKEAREKPSSVYISRSEVIKPYFKGYEQALKDMEDNDPACGVDLLEEIAKVMLKINEALESVNEIIDESDDDPAPDEAFALGQDRALRNVRSFLTDITSKVGEAQHKKLLERNAHES